MVEGTEGSHHKEGSTKMIKRTTICAGIDTGKRKLDVAIDGNGEQLQVENTAEGHKGLLEWLQRHKVKRIGIEASGGYEQPVVAALRRKLRIGGALIVSGPTESWAYRCGRWIAGFSGDYHVRSVFEVESEIMEAGFARERLLRLPFPIAPTLFRITLWRRVS